MARRSISIRFAMKLIALVAFDLSLAGIPEPVWLLQSPPLFFAIVSLNLVVIQAILVGRPLRAFHYTFLAVGMISVIGVTAFAYSGDRRGSLGVVESVLRWYRRLAGDHRMIFRFEDLATLSAVERFATSVIGLLPAWAMGLIVARWERRRGHRSDGWGRLAGAFAKGMVIGFGFFSIAATIRSLVGPIFPEPHTVGWYAHYTGLVCCPLVGGIALACAGRRRTCEGAAAIPQPTGGLPADPGDVHPERKAVQSSRS